MPAPEKAIAFWGRCYHFHVVCFLATPTAGASALIGLHGRSLVPRRKKRHAISRSSGMQLAQASAVLHDGTMCPFNLHRSFQT